MDIFPDGDVVLLVGEDNMRLRVHSQCLRSASQVFAAMFGPTWSEGQSLSRDLPTEVPLPEDNANAMRTICCIIHHRNELVPEQLTAEEVLRIAIAVDKYDIRIALKFASTGWLQPRESAERVEMGYLLAAAFLFNNTELFKANLLTLMTHYNGSYLDFFDDEITNQIIPSRMFHMLEERRTKLRAELCQLLLDGKNGNCSCGRGKNRSEKYGLLLIEYKPIKMLAVPMVEVITKMEQVSTEDMGRQYCSKMSHCGYYHEPLPLRNTFQGKLDLLKQKASICIDCVRSIPAADG